MWARNLLLIVSHRLYAGNSTVYPVYSVLENAASGCYSMRRQDEQQRADTENNVLENESREEDLEKSDSIVCRQCHHTITSLRERIEIDESHQHTFVNPGGIMFQIGCFRAARGCMYVGEATAEWSWFNGFRWQIAVCSSCLNHIGWHYTSNSPESFYGLILDRLIQPC